MTENRKTLLMLIFASVLSAIALIYGFLSIPSPAVQRELKLDHKRVSDLGELRFSIDEYYRNNNVLPTSLNDLQINSYSPSGDFNKKDPQSNQPYEYNTINATKYQLCAVFTTDSEKELDYYDDENYNYASFKNEFKHPAGRYCFTFNAPPVYNPLQQTYGPFINNGQTQAISQPPKRTPSAK